MAFKNDILTRFDASDHYKYSIYIGPCCSDSLQENNIVYLLSIALSMFQLV